MIKYTVNDPYQEPNESIWNQRIDRIGKDLSETHYSFIEVHDIDKARLLRNVKLIIAVMEALEHETLAN